MFAIAAAVLFGLALLFEIAIGSVAEIITPTSLALAGLLCVALHLSGIATALPRGRRR
ncbi:hypothetical protein [Nocardiopsis ansamitocini]|uniref:Uncharacterized protein n=1 Tax=Nocardiopsis ansamitocini TaxID=1670832 RepID=A0A9W6P267_9ACTN|nr:hypothetical protein [Nocardiopsis ansamitocini]GLU45741.1 hypothetical protein Nans01_00920 [Nocardiopsis ansamitocini]